MPLRFAHPILFDAPLWPCLQSGDVFQLVLSQRFERRTFADPFEIYRCAAHAVRSCR